MYRCDHCARPLPAAAAAMSSLTHPLECRACGLRQHRPMLRTREGVVGTIIVGLVGWVGWRATGFDPFAVALAPLLVLLVIRSITDFRAGRMTRWRYPSSLARWILAYFLVFFAAGTAAVAAWVAGVPRGLADEPLVPVHGVLAKGPTWDCERGCLCLVLEGRADRYRLDAPELRRALDEVPTAEWRMLRAGATVALDVPAADLSLPESESRRVVGLRADGEMLFSRDDVAREEGGDRAVLGMYGLIFAAICGALAWRQRRKMRRDASWSWIPPTGTTS